MQQSPVHARRRLVRPSTAPAKEVEELLPAQMAPNLSLGPSFLFPPAPSADPRQKAPSRPPMTLSSRLPVPTPQTLTGQPSPPPTRWADGIPTALPILLAPSTTSSGTSTAGSPPSPSPPPPRLLHLKAPLNPSQISPLPPTPLPSVRSC